MLNLEKREIYIILFLLVLLILGLFFISYHNRAPSIGVNVNSFSLDSNIPWQAKKININEADANSIASLKGIGKTLADRILEYRSKNGYFRSIEELKKVRGIGEKLFDRIKDRISID